MIQYHKLLVWTPILPPLIVKAESLQPHCPPTVLFNLLPLEEIPMPPAASSDITISELDVYNALNLLYPTKSMSIDGTGH